MNESPASEVCIACHLASERADIPIAFRTPSAIVGALLAHLGPDATLRFLESAEQTARVIATEAK